MIRCHRYTFFDPCDWKCHAWAWQICASKSEIYHTHIFPFSHINLAVLVFISFLYQRQKMSEKRCLDLGIKGLMQWQTASNWSPTVAQSPTAYTSPFGAPLTRRWESTSMAFLCTWLGRRLDTRCVKGFMAIPVDQRTKLDGIECCSVSPFALRVV